MADENFPPVTTSMTPEPGGGGKVKDAIETLESALRQAAALGGPKVSEIIMRRNGLSTSPPPAAASGDRREEEHVVVDAGEKAGDAGKKQQRSEATPPSTEVADVTNGNSETNNGKFDWASYKCREDIVGARGGRVEFYDFTKGIDFEAMERELRQAHQEELVLRREARLRRIRAQYNVSETVLNQPRALLTDINGKGGTSSMPLVGLGTWKAEPGQVRLAVESALRSGYRHVDCAENYQNENEVGEALESVLSHGVLKREDIFVTSKLWNSDHAKARVLAACKKSVELLKVEYLDLYLIHWPVSGNRGPSVSPSIQETWQAMEELVDSGLVKAIGVSNFSTKKVEELLTYARIKPAVLQVECHPYCRNDKLIQWCAKHDIHVTAYSPLGSPDSATMLKRDKELPALMDEPLIHRIAERVDRNVGQVLIRWGLQHGTSVLPKSTSSTRIRSNLLGSLDWTLSAEEFASLSSFDIQNRSVCGTFWLNPQGPYRTLEEFWDVPAVVPTRAQLKEARERRNRAQYKHIENQVSVPLNNGCAMPVLGFGTWKAATGGIGGAVEAAIKAGYRHIDCAEYYKNEGEIGEALARVFDDGVVKREDVFICSKLWNSDHAKARVLAACKKSVELLKVEYLDLYLIHWPVSGNRGPSVSPSIQETWQAMEELVDSGLVKAIGVSNFSTKKVEELLAYARIKPAVLQVECHPYCRNDKLIQWCAEHDIHVTAHSSLGSPDSASLLRRSGPVLMENDVVKRIAAKVGKNVGQVLIRWGVQHGTSVLAKSIKPSRISSNLDAIDWSLPQEEYVALCQLEQARMVDGGAFLSPQGPYRTLEEFWDTPDGSPEN